MELLKKPTPIAKKIEVARGEIVARACEDMLSRSKVGKEMFNSLSQKEQKTLVEKIKDIIQSLKAWVSEALGLYENASRQDEAQILRKYQEECDRLLNLWDEMLAESVEVNQALEKSGAFGHKTSADGDVLYALRKEAISEVEQAISNKNYDKEIKLTDSSPAILVSQKGVKNLPMMMVASHVRENILTEKEAKALGLTVNIHKHYHGLGKTLFLNVIDSLDNVTEAYRGTKNAEKSERRENYFLLISQHKDSNGDTINVPVYVNQYGRYNRIFVETNKIATVFGRDNFKAYIQNEIAKGNLVRIKNRSNQASESTSLIDGDYSKNASNNSIHNSNENVKENLSERDTEYLEIAKYPAKNEPRLREMVDEAAKEKGSILDDEGSPLMLYRGTEGGKTAFPVSEGHKGIVYTIDNVNIASNYGDKSGKATEISKQQKGLPSTYALYCFADNVLTIDAQYGVAHDLIVPNELLKHSEGRYKATETEVSEWAKLEGYDAVRVKNVRLVGMQVGEEVLVLKDNLLKSADTITYGDNNKVIPLSERFNMDNEDIRYSKRDAVNPKRITLNMSETERVEILRNKTITDIPEVKEVSANVLKKLDNISSWQDINNLFGKDKRQLIHKIAQEFGVFKEYNNLDINISFEFSNNNFRETYGKQKRNYESFAKMFSVFDKVIKNAIGIEVHNRNDEGYKPDMTLKNVYVLISAFGDGEAIVPVKLEVKEFKDKQNTLYIAVSLEAIKKTEVSKQGTTENSVAQNSRSVTISLPDIFAKVNPKDTSFLKYIPNEFLNDEQIKAKTEALEIEKRKYSKNLLYSKRDTKSIYDTMGETERIKKENEKLKADVERLNERLKLEKQVTHGNVLNDSHILKAAGHLRNIANSNIDKVQLARNLKSLYTFVAQSENLTWEEVYERSYRIAESILEESKPEIMVDDYSKMIYLIDIAQ